MEEYKKLTKVQAEDLHNRYGNYMAEACKGRGHSVKKERSLYSIFLDLCKEFGLSPSQGSKISWLVTCNSENISNSHDSHIFNFQLQEEV